MQCILCHKTALYRVGAAGYCKDHRGAAVRLAKKESRAVNQRHTMKDCFMDGEMRRQPRRSR